MIHVPICIVSMFVAMFVSAVVGKWLLESWSFQNICAMALGWCH